MSTIREHPAEPEFDGAPTFTTPKPTPTAPPEGSLQYTGEQRRNATAEVTFDEVKKALQARGPIQKHASPNRRMYESVITAQCPKCNGANMTVGNVAGSGRAGIKCNGDGCEPADIIAALEIVGSPIDPDDLSAVLDAAQHSGQVRMAILLAKDYGNKLMYLNGIGWHYWDGKRWAFDDTRAAHRAVLDVLRKALAGSLADSDLRKDVRKCESANGIAGVLAVAAALPQFAATPDDLNADPWLFNTANGTLDLRTLDLRPHSPLDRITKVTRAAYDPAAPGSTWPTFLNQVLPDEDVRKYLQRLIGVALLGKQIEHILPLLIGEGRNGKGVTYEALLWALGDYGLMAESDLFLARPGAHTTGQVDLMGRRLVVVSESNRADRLDEAKMKRLVGGDRIRARKLYHDNVEFPPTHLALMVTNHPPKVAADDKATWARLRVIEFTVSFLGREDKHLSAKLQAEADAVLAWAVAGWVDYRRRGEKLGEPPAVLAATGQYQLSNDPLARFVEERCVTSSSAFTVQVTNLYGEWKRWADGEPEAPELSNRAFGLEMERLGYQADKRNRERVRLGIRLKTELELADDDAA